MLADRAGRRVLQLRPYPISRLRLIVSLVAGVVLVAGVPTTWPIVIGCAIVCALLGPSSVGLALVSDPAGILRRCDSRSSRAVGNAYLVIEAADAPVA